MTIAWFTLSVITGNFIWRFSINVVFFFLTIVFLVSLFRIRKMIKKINTVKRFETNRRLLNLNLITFFVEGVTYGISFMLAIMETN